MAKIEIDTSKVSIFLNKNLGEKLPKNYNTRKVVSDIGEFISARIKVRTEQGKDVENRVFKPYAPSTKKFRQKRGRQTSKVDLIDTGQMLSGVKSRVLSNTQAVVEVSSDQQKKAISHQLGIGNPQRKFFGLSSQDKTTIRGIEKIAGDELDVALKKT